MAIVWAGGLVYLVKNGDKPKQVRTIRTFASVNLCRVIADKTDVWKNLSISSEGQKLHFKVLKSKSKAMPQNDDSRKSGENICDYNIDVAASVMIIML